MINFRAEKRIAWRQARLKSLEQDAMQAQMMIKNMAQLTDDMITAEKKSVEPVSIGINDSTNS